MSIYSFASSRAHSILSQLIDLGVVAPTEPGGIVASAKSPDHGIQVVITIASCEPWTVQTAAIERVEQMVQEDRRRRLTPQKRRILAILAGQPLRKGDWIAIKLGKRKADGNLRTALAEMVRDGFLVKGDDGHGYQLPPPPDSGHSRACAS